MNTTSFKGNTGRLRGGSTLVLVIFIMMILLTIATSMTALLSDRIKRFKYEKEKLEARCSAISSVSSAIQILQSDTNVIDSLDEEWARKEGLNIVDEESKLPILSANVTQVSQLLSYIGNFDSEASADELANNIINWRDNQEITPVIIEQLIDVPGMTQNILTGLSSFATFSGSGLININTASSEVMTAVALGAGADLQTASHFSDKIVRARKSGVVIDSIDSSTMIQLMSEGVASPSQNELEVISKLSAVFSTVSTVFSGSATIMSVSGENIIYSCDYSYDKANAAIISWTER